MGFMPRGGNVRRKGRRLFTVVFLLISLGLMGCTYLGIQKKKKEEEKVVVKDEMYTTLEEPQSVIKNYAGMVEDENVSWVWLKPDTRFGRYRSVAVVHFKNFSLATVPRMTELITEQVSSFLQSSGMIVAREGEMVLDGAVVDVSLKSGFIEKIGKILPGNLEDTGVTVSVEVVIGDAATNIILCKIRDQATAPELDLALKKIAERVVQYINLHR
jgi:hypothetical protein